MPEFVFTEESTGRELSFFGDAPPDQSTVDGAFKNYDALAIASAGPKGSGERRRAMAREVADQSRQTFTEESGGSTAGPLLSGTASLGQSLSRAGTSLMGGAARGFEMLKEGLGAPEAGFSLPEPGKLNRTAAEIEQDVQANPIYQQSRELQDQAAATYPVNPERQWANLPGQVGGSVAQMVATGPARIAAYALGALEGGAQQAFESGATPTQAQAQGLVEAATGAVTEKLLGLAPFLKDAGKMTARQFARQALTPAAGKVALQEAVQEPTEGILNRLSSKYVTGANPDEAVFDPQTIAMEAVGGGLGGAGLSIPTIAGAKIQRQRDVMGRRELGLAGRSEQQLQAELEAFNRGIQESQLTGGGGELVQQTGDPYRNQLDLSAQNAPPQFQMVTSEVPRLARGVGQRLAEADLREQVAAEGQTPIDQLLARPTQALPAATRLSQLEQSRQAQFPAGGAAVQPEQPQFIQPQGDLMQRLRDARKMDVLRQPSPMSAAQLGTGQPVGGPPAVADLTPFLQFYEAQAAAPQAPVAPEAPAAPVVQPAPVRRGVRMRAKTSRSIGMSRKPSQTITGSNEEVASEMPVQPQAQAQAGEAIDSTTQAELGELDGLMQRRGQAQNKVKGVSFSAKEGARLRQLIEKHRDRLRETVNPDTDPIVGTDINGSPIKQSARGTFYTFESGRVRTGPAFAPDSQPISRSEPAAAQGVATEGVGVSSSEETPAFGVRRYGDALFISNAEYNRLRPQIDERLALKDETAKRIDDIEVNAEQYVRSSAGFRALTPEGQEQAVGNFKTKLYQSAAKWLAGGEFQFSPPVIAKSIAMDIGKSKAERMRKSAQSGESSDEGGEEIRGAFESVSERVMPKQALKAPIKADQDIVLVVTNIRRQFGLTQEQMGRIMSASVDPEMEANLDDEELAVLEQVRPMLARLENVRYAVAGGIQLTEQGPFYSQLTRTIQSMPQETMTVGQARSAIEKGAKKDEVAMSGIFTDPLSPLYGKQPGDKVTKSELIGYALERQAKVEDVVLGEDPLVFKNDFGTLGQLMEVARGDDMLTTPEGYLRPSLTPVKTERGYNLRDSKARDTGTKFSDYQLPGGDDGSYREMFVTWSSDEDYRTRSIDREMGAIREEMWGPDMEGPFPDETTRRELTRRIESLDSDKRNLVWRDGHSQYASIYKPIVRIRRNIRTDANGKKTYFIEEIQGPQKANQEKMPPELRKRIYEIGMKRAIRDAVDSGADAIAWTTGKQQADRYDLSKQVLHVAWEKNNDGTYNINAPKPDGSPGVYEEDLSLDQVEELVGKDLAKKIEAGEGRQQEKDGGYRSWKILEGVDLIGGEGLRKLYDQTLPSIVNDLAKKFGVRVGMGEVKTSGSFTIMANGEEIPEGPWPTREEAQRFLDSEVGDSSAMVVEAKTKFSSEQDSADRWVVVDSNGRQVGGTEFRDAPSYKTKEDADAAAAKMAWMEFVHSLTIPEAMKAAAKTGLPLFSLFSLSSLIREPIGLARAQQAVARWKQENGVEGAIIEVVDDPELMTPDGRPVAAMVRTIPGQPPIITINAAQIASEQELIEKLWHEALHPVWEDQGVQRAWQEVLQTLPRNAIEAELARGYSPLEATMEAAINSAATQAANTPLRTAWQKFLDAVWEAMGRVFGFDTKPKDFEKLMEEALRSLSRPYNQQAKPGVLVASNAIVTAPGVTPDDYAITAHHGTPHKVDKFTTGKIGTGEGAQVYGWGLYFAENPAVGRQYAMNLGARDGAGNRIPGAMGNEYTVSLNVEPDDLLDWDKPLSEQSEKVRSAAMAAISQRIGFPFTLEQLAENMGHSPTGAEAYNTVQTNNQKESSERLRRAGIRGVRYLDQGSRVTPQDIKRLNELRKEVAELRQTIQRNEGKEWAERKMFTDWLAASSSDLEIAERNTAKPPTYNYVIFDENDITITHENGQEVAAPDATRSTERYSVANTIAMVSSAKATKATLETSGDPEAVAMMGQAAASLINPAFSDLMNRLSVAEPGTADATTYTFLKAADNMAASGAAVVEWAQSNQDPIPAFTNLSELPTGWRSVVGNVVMGAHLQLGQQMGSIDRAIERESAKLAEAAADLEDASKERLAAEAAKTEALNLLDGLMRTVVVERKKIGTSSATLSQQEADDAAKAIFGIKRNKLAVLSKAIETMAREMPVEGFVNNEAALAWLDERQKTAPIFGTDAADALAAMRKALARQADLTKRIEQVRAFTLDSVDAVREVGEIAKLIGKNKKATINNYAKLRSEYEAGFRRFKLASKKATDAATRLDGLLAAKEALSGLMASPDYLEKTNDAFLRGRGSLSGLMSEVKSDGRPTGVVEVYGPSAYVAAGNRVAKDKDLAALRRNSTIETWGKKGSEKSGTIYEIDYRPDFAIEAKNVEAIDRLSQEITQALNDESSPFYLTDPLARSSYTQLGAYLAQFVATNRYLIEQQLSDTMILTTLKGGRIFSGKAGILSAFGGDLYTTRMNAARAIGGRGGMEWEKANRASDLFEKKAGNVLKATRVENAVARRKAIESHGLNPDSREGIAQWSAHISAVIGSFQNPSQDRLKEGDYVGGMVVTKEDLKSAEIQKKFSTGVVGDFSSMTADLSEVVNPEEQFGSGDSTVLFTRAAEDYGLKTRRQFSQWGRQFKEDWATASQKDLEAFRINQAQATGDEPVPMVWTEREKLANREIEGPVYSHLTETNQEYSSKAPTSIRPAYARLRSAIKAGRGPKTVEGIGEAISQLTADAEGNATIDPITAKEALLGAIDSDVKAIGQAIGEWNQSTLGNSDLPDVIMGVKAANGALAKARGKMVAPTWFYDYGLHDDAARAVFVAQGKRILLMKVYETMGAFKEAVRRNLDEAKREIEENAKKRKANGDMVGYDAAEAEYDKKAKAKYRDGGEFATRKGLQRSFDTLEALQSELKSTLQVANEAAVDQLLARTIGSAARAQISVLLSSVPSILNNLTATVMDPWRTWSQSEKFWLKVGKTTKAVGNAFKFVASDMVAALPSSVRNKLTKKRKMALVSTISDFLRSMMVEREMMGLTGQFETFDTYRDKLALIRANPLSFGQSSRLDSSRFERMMSKLYSRAIYAVAALEMVRDRVPGYFDGVINRVLANDAREFEEWIAPHLWDWARNQPGQSVDEKIENARKSIIKGSDIGVSEENLASIRDFLGAAGSLESMAARLLASNGDQKMGTTQTAMSDTEREAVQFDAGRKYNIRASSTSPDVMKGGPGIKGTFKNILHTFLSWTFQRMGTDANQFLKKRGGGWKKEVSAAWGILMLVIATMIVGAFAKVPKDIWRWVTGDPATTPNILQAVDSPEMAMRYMASSTAGVLPMGGQIVAEMLGGTGISSPLDNNVLDNNPPAQFLASMVQTGQRIYQSGDLKYPLADFARKNFWPAGLVLNRVMEGDTEARAAKRAVRMAAAGMEVRPSGSGIGSRETPITPVTRNAIAALYEGDTGAFNDAREKAIAYYVSQGKTPKEAAKRFDSSVSGRDPLRSVLGRNPTEEEEATILRRLNPSQRRAVGKSRSLFRKPKKVRLGRSKSRKVRLGRKRPVRRSLRLRRAAS